MITGYSLTRVMARESIIEEFLVSTGKEKLVFSTEIFRLLLYRQGMVLLLIFHRVVTVNSRCSKRPCNKIGTIDVGNLLLAVTRNMSKVTGLLTFP